MAKIYYDPKKKEYTLKEGESILPPKYSPQDKYGKYRRQAKDN